MILVLLFAMQSFATDCRPSLGSVLAQLSPRIEAEEIGANDHVLRVFVQQELAALVAYRILPDGTLSIDSAVTLEKFERQGFNSMLWREIMHRHPDVREVESMLMQDNLDAYNRSKRQAEEDGLSIACESVVRATPAYRVRIAHGFTRIVECSVLRAGILLRMGRI